MKAAVLSLVILNNTYYMFQMTCEITSNHQTTVGQAMFKRLKYSPSGITFHWNALRAVRCEELDHYLPANRCLLQTTHANKSLQGWLVEQNATRKKTFTIKCQHLPFSRSSPCSHITSRWRVGHLNVREATGGLPRLGCDQRLHEQVWVAEVGQLLARCSKDNGSNPLSCTQVNWDLSHLQDTLGHTSGQLSRSRVWKGKLKWQDSFLCLV